MRVFSLFCWKLLPEGFVFWLYINLVIMLQLAFLSVLLCSQYAAGTPVMFSVHGQGADDLLRLNIVPVTWTEADLHCRLEGGVLASPTTSDLAQAMQTAMADHKLSSGVFIGVTDLVSKGEFRSLDGASVADIPLEWAAGEPNNVDNAEQCLAMTGAGALADVSCSAVLPYFCLKKSADIGVSTQHAPCNGRQDYELEPRTGSCYKFHGLATPWRSALQTCRAEGGHLAIINNQTEATVLKEIHNKNQNDITGAFDATYTSIGFNKWADNQWLTLHGETISEAGFTEWSNTEPNNRGGNEHCGTIFENGLLNDAPCETAFPYICEITP